MNDDAFDRLRAADPAHEAPEPAAGVLRAKVDALIGAGAPGASAGSPPPGDTGTDELARRRSRGRQPWLVAAAVAGVVAVGGGGYAAGSNGLLTASVSDSAASGEAADAAPPILLDGSGAVQGRDDGAVGAEGLEEAAPDSLTAIGREPAVGTFLYPAPSHTVFHAGAGLSDDVGELPAYMLDAQVSYTRESAEEAARELGLPGDVRQENGVWVAGADDGTGASLRLAADGRTSIWYHDAWQDAWRCGVEPGLPPDDAVLDDDAASSEEGSSSSSGMAPGGTSTDSKDGFVPPCEGDGDAGAPSSSDASDELRRLMKALEIDVDAFEFRADKAGIGTSVTAFHRIGDRRTGLQWSATVAGTGADLRIVSLSGFLAPVTELGTYPVVSEREAVQRLGDARFGATPSGVRTLGPAELSEDPDEPAPDGPPASLEPGAPISWPVRDVTITSAQLGVAQHVLADGAVVLIPAYEMTGDEGSWSVIAVSDGSLDFTGR